MGVTHLSGLQVAGVPTMGVGGLPPFTGNWYFVDYYRGSDGNAGTADSPLKTLYQAQVRMIDGNNDVAVIVPSPLSSSGSNGTQRMSYANALLSDSAATSGTLKWAKNACHIIGLSGPVQNSRCRLAPDSTGTAATFLNSQAAASTPLVKVSGQGCIFMNFSVWGGFATGNAGFITWHDSGGRNYYQGVTIAGHADAASAGGTAARDLLITSGENKFVDCVIGTDTVQRITGTTTTLEFAVDANSAGVPRNKFYNCDFPLFLASAAAATNTVYAGTDALDRITLFQECNFLCIGTGAATGVAQTGAIKLANAATGRILFKNCSFMGATGIFASGDTTTSGQIWVDGAGPVSNATASSTGIPITPYV